ncbi:MAG TPA: hypothetical protein VNC50_09965 [Planctomycetia bacterium]|nr:hypothetical protein [Planctomycetia bacterium]
MKFWLTVILGVIVISAGTATMLVLNPNMRRSNQLAEIDPSEKSNAPQGRAVPEGAMEHKLGVVAQHKEGQVVYKIKNEGEAPLQLDAGQTTCTCTSLFLDKREWKLSDPPPEKETMRRVILQPKEIGYVMARWASKDKLGLQNVGIPIGTSDPKQRAIHFKLSLDIYQELMLTPASLDFALEEGESANRYVDLLSVLRDKVEAKDLQITVPFLTARVGQTPKETLQKHSAKSGVRIYVDANGKQPVGSFTEYLTFMATTSAGTKEERRVPINGVVAGEIFHTLERSSFDFREITLATYKPKEARIFAKRLKDGEILKVGETAPNFVKATIAPHPEYPKAWTLRVEISPDAPEGKIENGKITVLDGKGNQKLFLKVTGFVDPERARAFHTTKTAAK